MNTKDSLFATVTFMPSRQACYVPVNVPGHDGIPLALKATFQGFDRASLESGTIVEVSRTDHRVLAVLGRSIEPTQAITMCAEKETTGEEVIEFFLQKRYFQGQRTQNGFKRVTMVEVLRKCFNMTSKESYLMMENHPDGFRITCRPEQFSKFIITRCDVDEGVNGIRDLKAEYTKCKPIAARINVSGRP